MQLSTVVIAAALTAAACQASSDPATAPGPTRRDPPIVTTVAATATTPTSIELPTPVTAVFYRGRDHLTKMRTDGRRLYGHREVGDRITHLVRLDVDTGDVVAEYEVKATPIDQPEGDIEYGISRAGGLIVLDGERHTVTVLDPDTLAVRHEIPLPNNARTELLDDGIIEGNVWLGHKGFDVDRIHGRHTLSAVSLIDPVAGRLVETVPVPECGTKGAIELDGSLVMGLECVYQAGVLDRATGSIRRLPTFPLQTDVFQAGGDIWFRWSELGVIAKFDPATRRYTALDLNAGGPTLRSVYDGHFAIGDLWLMAEPADPELKKLLFRIDPDSVTIVGRAHVPGAVAVLSDGRAFASSSRTPVEFDARTVDDPPGTTVRPQSVDYEAVVPDTVEERAVLDVFMSVYDPTLPTARVADGLEDPQASAPVRRQLTDFGAQFGEIAVLPLQMSINQDRASISYVFTLDGEPAFVPLIASLVRIDGEWKVTAESICRIAEAASIGSC